MTVEFPYFVIEHFENEGFPQDGWCCREYLNILRIVTPARLIITNMTKENQAKLYPEFKDCAAISDKPVTDFVFNKNNINDDPSTPLVLRELATFHHNNTGSQTIATPVAQTTQPQELQQSTTITSSQICFLDEYGTGPIEPADLPVFRYVIFGGILGTNFNSDHTSTDRGGVLRQHGFQVRHLGPKQMSTDTAVLACAVTLRHGIPIADLEVLDDPEVFEDEIDKIPLVEQIAAGQAKKKQLRKMRESTAIRMRYLTHQQKSMDDGPFHTPRTVQLIDRSLAEPIAMTSYPCICDCPECGEQRKANGNNHCNINHVGDWYHSRTQNQINLHTQTQTRIPRITPLLLEHIFSSLDDGLFDLEGQLDIDFEAMALGIDEQEDKQLYDALFTGMD